MSDHEKARKILKNIKDITKELIDLWNKFAEEFIKKKKLDKDTLKKMKEKLKELKKLKLDFLKIYKLRLLYKKFYEIDIDIIYANAYTITLDKKIPEETKKTLRELIKGRIKEVKEKKENLENKFKKQFKTGTWKQPFETMNKYIEQIYKHKYLDDKAKTGKELSEIIKPLHKLKRSIIESLSYKIGKKKFFWWYSHLSKFDNKIMLLLEAYKSVRKSSDIEIFLDTLDRLFMLEIISIQLEKQIPKSD